MTLALQMRGISKRFPGVVANDQVDLQVVKGEIHALLGENGAGKTTLMQVLCGLYRPDAGGIWVGGKPVHFSSPKEAMAHGIGMVHQHFMLVPEMTVTENIILGQEARRRGFFLARRQAEQRIRALAAQYHLDIEARARVQDLSLGMRQRVEILKALYRQADILILDEPTAVLTPAEASQVCRTLTALARGGTTVILITHKLREVMEVAHRLTVMRHGRVVWTTTPAETSEAQLVALMVGADLPPPLAVVPRATSGAAVLQVDGLRVVDARGGVAVDRVSFAVRAGEIFGIAGVQGNGQTELVEGLTGLRASSAGTVTMQGVEVTNARPRRLAALGMGHIPEDRHTYGMVGSYTIADNLILNTYHRRPFARGLVRQGAAITAHARRLMQRFDIRAPGPETPAASLSGGNQQKLVIARELAGPLRLLIAAQPTRGLDVGAAAFVQRQLVQQREQGCAVLLVSTELDEIMALADRIAVICRGTLVAVVDATAARREELGRWMAGLD